MRSVADPGVRLVSMGRGGLPDWYDRFFGRAEEGDIFASRFWYEMVSAHALPSDMEPVLAICGAEESLLVPLLRQGGRLRSLVTPYTLEWRPLAAKGADARSLHEAGRSLGQLLRNRAPTCFDALDPTSPGLEEILEGIRTGGLTLSRYRHFGNWRQSLPRGGGWNDYVAQRPPALRTTILRKLARAARELRFCLDMVPGDGLERAIRAYVAVRESSWKPAEPFPHFDAALLRGAAAIGVLRMGVLWRADGLPVAAQYWIVGGGRAALLKLAHDERARDGSPGTVLTAMMIRHLIEADRVTELDFGRGDDAYKQLWVGGRRQRIGIMISDPWHPQGLWQLARQAASRGRAFLQGSSGA